MKTSGFLCTAFLVGVATVLAKTPNLDFEDLSDIVDSLKELEKARSTKHNTTYEQLSSNELQDQTQRAGDPGPWNPIWIAHDQIQPFAEPKPVTIVEKAAVKYKPQLHIANGCYPYPAVNKAGETSRGLTIGFFSSSCKGSTWGSQVYGRAKRHKGVWVIVYAWYFPKDSPSLGLGHCHDWEHVMVWISNITIADPKLLAVTPSAHSGYSKHVPPEADTVSGTSVKVKYESSWPINHALGSTTEDGEFQPLIMWEQLPEKARCAFNGVSWGDANMPINDKNFHPKLEKAWPFANQQFIR